MTLRSDVVPRRRRKVGTSAQGMGLGGSDVQELTRCPLVSELLGDRKPRFVVSFCRLCCCVFYCCLLVVFNVFKVFSCLCVTCYMLLGRKPRSEGSMSGDLEARLLPKLE